MRLLHRRPAPDVAAILAAVASESLPYTDSRAEYRTAVAYRATRTPTRLNAAGRGADRVDEP
jgi:hypothetical protein